MAYSDILKATSLYGNLLNKNWSNAANNLKNTQFHQGPVNPNTSEAYFPSTSRDLYMSGTQDVYNPMLEWQDYKPYKGSNLALQGSQAMKYSQIGKTLTPVAQDVSTLLGQEGTIGSLAPATALYGLTQNQNPYDFTMTERLGTIGSTALAAHSLAPVLNPVVGNLLNMPLAGSAAATTAGVTGVAPIAGMHPALLIGALLLGNFFGNKQKSRVESNIAEVKADVEGKQDKAYKDRQKNLEEMRNNMLAQQQKNMWLQTQGQYSNQYGGAYADQGMKFSPKELNKIAKSGRNGDTMLAHVNPQEAALLKALGGSGTKNPYTGLPEYGYGNVVSSVLDPVGDLFGSVGDVLDPVVDPFFDAADDVLEGAQDVATPVIQTAADITSAVPDVAGDIFTGALDLGTDVVQTGLEAATDLADPIVRPVLGAADDVLEVAQDVADPILDLTMGTGTEIAQGVIEGSLAGMQAGAQLLHDTYQWAVNPIADFVQGILNPASGTIYENYQASSGIPGLNRPAIEGSSDVVQMPRLGTPVSGTAPIKDDTKKTYSPGDWVSGKPNPYIAPNVEEELDYAARGMKYKYNQGGKMDIVAEFTGNELIVNDQDKVEKGLASGNYSMAATPIRRAMAAGTITPGPETHRNNPMPVDSQGNIYAGGGKLKFKVKKGAGVYDHATDQFKPTMTDKEIAMTAYNNIAKWKSNGMA